MKLFLSQQLDFLVDPLIQELDLNRDPMRLQTILVPNGGIRQWLLLEIAKRKGIAMGLKIIEPQQLFPSSRTPLEKYCSIYTALGNGQVPELIGYLEGKKKRRLELTGQLASLFTKYEQNPSLLNKDDWQTEMIQELASPQEFAISEPIICFAIDYLPPLYWQSLLNAPALSIYQFSPCIEFWEDICSDKERKSLNRYWKKRGAKQEKRESLDGYLRQRPRNLANWGKLGRLTLRGLNDLELEECYFPLEPTTLLTQIQYDLLTFEETKEPKIDPSIQILQTGSSKLAEIEALKEEILRIDIPYGEISVLAPDIEPYVPLIEYVFGDGIPFRISKIDSSKQSSFKQGLLRLMQLGSGRWEAEEILSLFETPSFYRKKGWDAETLERFRGWIENAKIEWGIDASHRKSVLKETLGEIEDASGRSWEKGLDALLDALIYLKPMQINPDLFEELLSTLFELQALNLKGEKTLVEWAEVLQKTADTFLLAESDEDAIVKMRFSNLMLQMRKNSDPTKFPLDIARHFLSTPAYGQINGSKLHAVRFSSIEEGSMIPARALFLIGMDEMSFPRIEMPSSLDLLKGKIPSQGDYDRYAFLQAIFAAKELLRISYGHLSAEEGKPVNPSLLVQELLSVTGPSIVQTYRQQKTQEVVKRLHFPPFARTQLPEGEMTLSIHELKKLARHPWKFFLQNAHNIFLDEELEDSFKLLKGKLVRDLADAPIVELPGSFKTAMEMEVRDKVEERKELLKEWQIEPIALHLRENCTSLTWDGPSVILPAIVLHWDNLKIKLVGEIKMASLKGIISLNEDNIGGTLKIWPEVLAASIAMDTTQIWMLRNGKTKSICNAHEQLKTFVEYYFHCLHAPSPLLPEWADSILRKKDLGNLDSRFEDAVLEWVLARAEWTPESIEKWMPCLQSTFQGLIDLYPPRGSEKTAHTPDRASHLK
ncbi:MAG: exodeoxyribonuclease V subunit gamma [Parachlamydiales bacterium]|nr:exodeoxyribonuclease V subunit gamma [Parachlamydiales bacterium]